MYLRFMMDSFCKALIRVKLTNADINRATYVHRKKYKITSTYLLNICNLKQLQTGYHKRHQRSCGTIAPYRPFIPRSSKQLFFDSNGTWRSERDLKHPLKWPPDMCFIIVVISTHRLAHFILISFGLI